MLMETSHRLFDSVYHPVFSIYLKVNMHYLFNKAYYYTLINIILIMVKISNRFQLLFCKLEIMSVITNQYV